MGWTKEQLDAITARGQNLLVSAAAGSGKTAVLTERVAQLAEEGTDLSRMLIITFTNAAAAEMKQRISEKVPLSVFVKYSISTFNKFAIEIYKNYYHIINMPPGLAVCDEYKQEIFRSEVLDDMFEELFESGDEDLMDLLNCCCSAKSNDALRSMISSLYDFTQSMPDPEGWLASISESCFDPKVLAGCALSSALGDLKNAAGLFEKADSLLGPKNTLMPKLREANGADLSQIQAICSLFEEGRSAEAAEAFSSYKFRVIKASKAEADAFAAVEDDFRELREKAKKLAKEGIRKAGAVSEEQLEKERGILQPHVKRLCRFTAEFAERYSKKKLSAGLMDFSDAEHFALRILEDAAVRAELQDRYEYIFVDEYQDSNYVQEELIRRISRGNNVFLVGDVKQSIYKFRLAQPEIFIEKYKDFKAGKDPLSRVIDLNRNFRSKTEVIDLVNSVFGRVMTEDAAGMDYDDSAALIAGAPYDGPCRFPPKLCLIQRKPDEDEAQDEDADDLIEDMKAEELEAINAARLIKQYHGRTISSKEGERPLKYSDMAVLLRSAKNRGEVFYQTLTKQGIPVYLERGEGYFDTPEIKVFLSLLKITGNPRRDTDLISVMHFPSFGFSSAELARIRLWKKDRRTPYYKALLAFVQREDRPSYDVFPEGCGADENVLRSKAADFLEKLALWREKSAALPLGDLVWDLLHESGIASYAQALPGGQQRIANLRAMADRAESYESETAGGISGFVSYIEMIAGNGKVDTGQVKLLTEADDVVRIMTVHKSKGLEFPLVLLAGLGGRLGGKPDILPVKRHRDLGVSMKIADPDLGLKAVPESFRIIDSVLKNEEFAEDIRVLYVAMTRARDILLMSAASADAWKYAAHRPLYLGSGKSFMKNYLSMILPSVPASCIEAVSLADLRFSPEQMSWDDIRRGIESGFKVDEKALPTSLKELNARLDYSYAPDPQTMRKRKYSVSEILELSAQDEEDRKPYEIKSADESLDVPVFEGDTEQPASFPQTPGKLTGAQKGTAYHSVMEHIPFGSGAKDAKSIAEFIEDLRQRRILKDAEAEAVDPRRIEAFFATDLAKRAAASPKLCKEAPFVMQTLMDGREVFVQGVIDCYFEEDGEYVLLDYKSNYVDRSDPEGSKEKLREHYLPQLELYKQALELIGGIKVRESYLYLFGLDDYIRI